MQIIEETQLDFTDVLIKPRRSTIVSRKDADITRAYKFKWNENQIVVGTGIMQANMGTIGNFEVSKKLLDNGLFACLHKHHSFDDLMKFYESLTDDEYERCFLSIGLRDKEEGIEKIQSIQTETKTPSICVDVPNGYIPQVKDLVIELRNLFPNSIIMVGNVVTGDITEDLILSGADIVKVGIGSGAQCLTRRQTGCGRPQFSTIVECADAAHQVGGMVCSDGGITCPGDIGKAFGAGADFIMVGSMFAGCDEAEGNVVEKVYVSNEMDVIKSHPFDWIRYPRVFETENEFLNSNINEMFAGELIKVCDDYYIVIQKPCDNILNYTFNDICKKVEHYEYKPSDPIKKKFKQFYGMSSTLAQEKFGNGKPSYRASEGRVTLVPYSGPIQDTIEEFLGGLRSTMTYIGASRLKDIPKCCVFYKVNNQLNKTFENSTIGK